MNIQKKLAHLAAASALSFVVLPLLPRFAVCDNGSAGILPKSTPGVVAGFTISAEAPGGNNFLGSEGCARCHKKEYDGWKKTFHSTAVKDVKSTPSAILADLDSDDLPFTREDIEYAIGSHWDQRYMTRIGGEYYVLPRLWAVQSKEWRPYSVWSWKQKPYARYCAGCHTTYIDPVKRTIGDDNIGCEACHGPGGRHAQENGEPSLIVNPAGLSIERHNMVCASCHVRGTDKSGQYYYAVGYLPGEDLAEYYKPLDTRKGESVGDAISRLYGEWKQKKLNAAQARCEVCGIEGTGKGDLKNREDDVMSFCFSCHNFRNRLQLHTHHPSNVRQTCTDCHVPRAKSLKDSLEGDIHSYSYFLVHNENCYDSDIGKACASCHSDVDDAVTWAEGIIGSWRKPVVIDH